MVYSLCKIMGKSSIGKADTVAEDVVLAEKATTPGFNKPLVEKSC